MKAKLIKFRHSTTGRAVLAILILFLLLMLVMPVYFVTSPTDIDCPIIYVYDGFEVNAKGVVYKDANLNDLRFEMTTIGDVVTFTKVLPNEPVIETPQLEFYSLHSIIDVSLDGEEIYSYGHEYYDDGEMIGYGKNMIPLPDDYMGKTLFVRLEVTEKEAFENITPLKIVTGVSYSQYQISQMRFNFVISMFLIVLGLMAILLSAYMVFTGANFFKITCIALFTFWVGVWTSCNLDLIMFYTPNLRTKAFLEYISFYLMPLPLMGYFAEKVTQIHMKKWMRIFYYAICGVQVLFVLIVFGNQILGIEHFPGFISMNQMMIVLTMIFVVMEEIQYAKFHPKEPPAMLIGFGLAFLFIAFELVKYNIIKYQNADTFNPRNNVVGVASLIVVAALAADIANRVKLNVYAEAKEKLLRKLAFQDELTGLANRRKCEEAISELEYADKPYAIISLDMNGLKHFNDTYGHEIGDKSLKDFADVLGASYPNSSTLGRMGGDEFIVVLPGMDRDHTEYYVEKMKANIASYNAASKGPIMLSTACGCAYAGERHLPHEVYSLADERMYENKREMKAKGLAIIRD